jgi:starch phosphorylase
MEMKQFFVKPNMPQALQPLYELANNVWTTWDKDAGRLLRRMDPTVYEQVQRNPVALLLALDSERLSALAEDAGFLNELENVYSKFKEYMGFKSTFRSRTEVQPDQETDTIAYFSMEFGLHESLPIYSGGLGVLAGDHLKAASDLGFNMIGFGLLYKYGYFTQFINVDGLQGENYVENNWYEKPISEVKRANGEPFIFSMTIKDFPVWVKLWQIDVGKVPLYLLDTNIPQNDTYARGITNHLYVADRKRRLEQEILLGMGSLKAMEMMEINPKLYHLNEGHSAFLVIERLRQLMVEENQPFEIAKQIIRHSTVFTTHTPVVEGNEHFEINLIEEYLKNNVAELGIPFREFLKFGQIDQSQYFWLPAFAIQFSRFSNGVSALHGKVSRQMWHRLFPNLREEEVPIGSVTNGVHLQTWLSTEMTYLFDRYVGPGYLHHAQRGSLWSKIDEMPDSEVWHAHKRAKEHLISFIRSRRQSRLKSRGASLKQINAAKRLLNPEYLTVGFARRFAPYKRANLILQDKDRLYRILTNPNKPVQFIFAGKAHPADGTGKQIMKEIINFAKEYNVEDRFVFVEDYGMGIAKRLVQGVDVWLNTPIKPMEASGTSGMKVGMNGGLNLSILDGWWPECFNENNGWAITAGEIYQNPDMKLVAEAHQIYELLEDEITDIYYDLDGDSFSEKWVLRMKDAIKTVGKGFNMHRMLKDYYTQYYRPILTDWEAIETNEYQTLKTQYAKTSELKKLWASLYIKEVFSDLDQGKATADQVVAFEAYAYLDGLDASAVTLEILYSPRDEVFQVVPLTLAQKYEDQVAKFSGTLTLSGSGVQAFNVRLVPSDERIRHANPDLVKWFLAP